MLKFKKLLYNKTTLRIFVLISIMPMIMLVGMDDSVLLPTEYFMEENSFLTCITFGLLMDIGVFFTFMVVAFLTWLFVDSEEYN
jgi:hypothetical protein